MFSKPLPWLTLSSKWAQLRVLSEEIRKWKDSPKRKVSEQIRSSQLQAHQKHKCTMRHTSIAETTDKTVTDRISVFPPTHPFWEGKQAWQSGNQNKGRKGGLASETPETTPEFYFLQFFQWFPKSLMKKRYSGSVPCSAPWRRQWHYMKHHPLTLTLWLLVNITSLSNSPTISTTPDHS